MASALRTMLDRWLLRQLRQLRQTHRWAMWLIQAWVALLLLFLLGCLALLVFEVGSLVRHGTGTLGGQAEFIPGGPQDFRPWLKVASLWLFGLVAVAPLSLLRIWWHFGRTDRPQAAHRDLEAAQEGEPAAALRLAQHFRDRDPQSRRAWLLQAAKGGSTQAMVELARDLREGLGGLRDPAAARQWAQHALAAGAPEAAEILQALEATAAQRLG